MSIKEQLFKSFIKGIGKTTGTVAIFGIIGCAWYYYTKPNSSVQTEKKNEEQDIVLEDIGESNESESRDEIEELEDIVKENLKQERNYRKIFDKI
jgi:hypothetical protein